MTAAQARTYIRLVDRLIVAQRAGLVDLADHYFRMLQMVTGGRA